jgi:hypothetical protein
VFRKIDQWGNVDCLALTPKSVNLILRSHCEKVGRDRDRFHSTGCCAKPTIAPFRFAQHPGMGRRKLIDLSGEHKQCCR